MVIGARAGGGWQKLAQRLAPDKFLLYEDLDKNIFLGMARRKDKKHWLVIVDDKIGKMREFAKMVDLTKCRHSGKDEPCCHFCTLCCHLCILPSQPFNLLFELELIGAHLQPKLLEVVR